MKENSKKLWSDFKYWLFGNILVLISGFLIVFLFILFELFENYTGRLIQFLTVCFYLKAFFFYMAIFLIALGLKLIKRDLPVYFYSSISFLTIFLGYPCLKEITSWFYPPLFEIERFFGYSSLHVLYLVLCSSLIGGSVVDVYCVLKKRNSLGFVTMKEGLKYWLLGNFLMLNLGFAMTIVCVLMNNYKCNLNLIPFYFLCLVPFLGALIIKLQKHDLSPYFYGSSGLIYIILIMPCSMAIDYVLRYRGNIISHLSFEKECNPRYLEEIFGSFNFAFIKYFIVFLVIVIGCSLLGGIVGELYLYLKYRYSISIRLRKIFYSLKK